MLFNIHSALLSLSSIVIVLVRNMDEESIFFGFYV